MIFADSRVPSILNFPKLSPSARIAGSVGLPSNSREVMAFRRGLWPAPGLPNISSNSFAGRVTPLAADIAVPVPLHRQRIRECGFNQVDTFGGPWLVVCDSLVGRSLSALVGAPKNICYAVMSAGQR